ncbi:AAA family ATPase [Massilia sp.]|uniref:AAA family ATPase n=1 Tax=Massilia sp. TaxID=1882437 RepID=UPI0028A0B58A|nr:AAA family ATPase [Massilia sp.]
MNKFAAKPYLQRIWPEFGSDVDLGEFPFNVPAVRDLQQIDFHADVTFFVGENGSGKSTVLEAIALALGFGVEGGPMSIQLLDTLGERSALARHLRMSRSFKRPQYGYFMRAESFFNVATYMDKEIRVPSYGGKELHARSHGEAFMSVLLDKFRANGLYLLDEPEAALSPNRQLAALRAIDQLVQQGSQFIIVTHSPILLAYPNAKILAFDATGISEIAYEDTEHFAVTRDFLNHYPRRLEQLLAPD